MLTRSKWLTGVVVLAVSIAAASPVSAQTHPSHDAPPDSGAATSRLNWSGFADVAGQKTDESGDPNTFSLGQFTLYPTATLSDRPTPKPPRLAR